MEDPEAEARITMNKLRISNNALGRKSTMQDIKSPYSKKKLEGVPSEFDAPNFGDLPLDTNYNGEG